MEAPSYFVKVLSAMVKVVRRAEDGAVRMRAVGFHPATGEPLLAPDSRYVTLQQGDPLPADVADGEVDRLLGLDPPSIGRKAAVSVLSAPSGSPSKTRAAGKKSTAKRGSAKKAAAKRSTAKPAPAAPVADLGQLASLSDADLVTAISAAGAAALLEAVGSDATLAGRVLAAEMAASNGDPRSELVDGLDKVIQGAAS